MYTFARTILCICYIVHYYIYKAHAYSYPVSLYGNFPYMLILQHFIILYYTILCVYRIFADSTRTVRLNTQQKVRIMTSYCIILHAYYYTTLIHLLHTYTTHTPTLIMSYTHILHYTHTYAYTAL